MSHRQDGSGLPGEAEFRLSRPMSRALAPMIFPLALLALTLLLLGSIGGIVVGVLVAIVGTAIAVTFLVLKLRRVGAANVLRVHAAGITWDSGGGVVHQISWPDLTGAGSASTQLAPRRRVHLAGTPRQVDVSMTSSGVHGWSESRLPNRLPAVTRQALADMPRNGTGKLHVGIPLSLFDPDWQDGPIGKLIWHYRPDLMERRDVG